MVCFRANTLCVATVLTTGRREEERTAVASQATALGHHESLLDWQTNGGYAQDVKVQPLQTDRDGACDAKAYREVPE
jgi:hypothetical protein